ncbi:ISChy9, transposase orfB, partial [mine drainage metagenome]
MGKSSIDIGPSTIAAVSETDAFLERFCASVPDLQQAIRRIQRAMDRSRRGSNPDHYHRDGTVKKATPGKRLQWVLTTGYLRLRARLRELHRVQAADRRTEHGKLANHVIAMGHTVLAEKLSDPAFQRMFGQSVRDRAPGAFMDHLRRKAASAGGEGIEFPTRTTKLSPSCPCGAVVKKPLSQRWHEGPCGVCAQRDGYRADPGLHVRESHGAWMLDTQSDREGGYALGPLLEQAVSGVRQSAKGGLWPVRLGLRARDRAALSR